MLLFAAPFINPDNGKDMRFLMTTPEVLQLENADPLLSDKRLQEMEDDENRKIGRNEELNKDQLGMLDHVSCLPLLIMPSC